MECCPQMHEGIWCLGEHPRVWFEFGNSHGVLTWNVSGYGKSNDSGSSRPNAQPARLSAYKGKSRQLKRNYPKFRSGVLPWVFGCDIAHSPANRPSLQSSQPRGLGCGCRGPSAAGGHQWVRSAANLAPKWMKSLLGEARFGAPWLG